MTANGSTVTAQGFELETSVGGGTYAALSLPYTVTFADNGKNIRYYATNGCGTTYSNLVVLTVDDKPTIATVATPADICAGSSLTTTLLPAPTVTANGSTVTAQGFELETSVGGGTYAALSLPYPVSFADNGKNIRYYATNDCGTTYSNVVVLTVRTLPTVSITGNNSPICSGGNAVFDLSGTSDATVTYNINGGNNQTVTLMGGTA